MELKTDKIRYFLDYELSYSKDTVRRSFENIHQVESYINKHRLKDRVKRLFKIENISIK